MTGPPRVGIVTPCRNRREKTARFLAYLRAQTYPARTVYVVDSNSSDGTPEMIRRTFPEVVLLTADDSKFWTGATNVGVRRALADGCDYILTINDDSAIDPNWLAIMVDEAERHGRDVLGSRIDFFHQPGKIWSTGAFNDWAHGQLFQLSDLEEWEHECATLATRATSFEVETLCGNGVLIRRRVFERTGLYDEKWLPHYHADSEFVLRARRRGFRAWVTTLAILRNDVFNDGPRTGVAEEVPAVVPGNWKSLLRRWNRDAKKLFGSIRSDLYWRALLAYIVRHCPKHLLVGCLRSTIVRLWRGYFRPQWEVFRYEPPRSWFEHAPARLYRQQIVESRAPVPKGELSMDVMDALDRTEGAEFLSALYRSLLGREPDASAEGFLEGAATQAGRDRLVHALLYSTEARLTGLGRRATPLAQRMLQWRTAPPVAKAPLQHLCEDVDRMTALAADDVVVSAYREFLGREPERAALAPQTEVARKSPGKLLAAVMRSAEYSLNRRRHVSPLVARWADATLRSAPGVSQSVLRADVPVQSLANTVGE